MARSNQYNSNQAGADMLKACETFRKVLMANIDPFLPLEAKVEADENEKWLNGTGVELTTSKARADNALRAGAFYEGREYGRTVSLNQQVGSAGGNLSGRNNGQYQCTGEAAIAAPAGAVQPATSETEALHG